MLGTIRLASALVATLAFVSRAATAQVPAGAGRPADTLFLSVAAAVERALQSADEARLADAQVDLADAQLTVARAGGLPQLRLGASYNRTFESARGQAVGRFFSQPNTYSTSLNLSQPLFQGGREWAAMRAASRLRAAARLDASETRAALSLAVQRAYLEALFAGRLVEIRATNFQLASERLVQVERFQTAGRAARFDVLRARVERANLEPLVIEARNDRELATLELKRLLNIPVEQPVALTTTVDAQTVQAVLASLDSRPAEVPDRASVRAAELAARARRDAVAVARADFLPTVSAFFQYGFQAFPLHGFPTERGRIIAVDCPESSPATQVCTAPRGDWFEDAFLGVSFSWPLFDGLRAKGNLDQARAQARIAELQLGQEREAVALEVARARSDLERARSLFAARRENATEADEAYRLASLRFARGLGTQLEASDTQLALLTAQTNEARAVYDLYLATAELARALGRPIPLAPGGGVAPSRVGESGGVRGTAPTSTSTTSTTSRAPDSRQ